MKSINFAKIVMGAAVVSVLSACGTIASNTQTDADLREKAAFALNTSSDNITVLSKSSNLQSLRFQVKSDKGIYNCDFTSIVVVNSDAICSGPVSASQKAAVTTSEAKPAQTCNALLKAANRC